MPRVRFGRHCQPPVSSLRLSALGIWEFLLLRSLYGQWCAPMQPNADRNEGKFRIAKSHEIKMLMFTDRWRLSSSNSKWRWYRWSAWTLNHWRLPNSAEIKRMLNHINRLNKSEKHTECPWNKDVESSLLAFTTHPTRQLHCFSHHPGIPGDCLSHLQCMRICT